MPLLFIYKSLAKSGINAKILGYKPQVVKDKAELIGWREESMDQHCHTIVPDEKAVTIGQVVSLSDEDIAAVDAVDQEYERIQVPLEGYPCFAYVMKQIYKREEINENLPELSKEEEAEFLSKAMERFDDIVEKTENIREEFVEDLRFKSGHQWPLAIIQERQRDSRPCLTINRVANFIDTVVNQQLQNTPSIKIRPVNDTTDPQTAEVISGLIRSVVNNGDSKTAIDQAFDDAVSGGFGFFRVNTRYCDNDGFGQEQEFVVDRVENPCAIYYPFHLLKTLDYSDATYCFVRTKITKDEAEQRFGDEFKAKMESFTKSGVGDRDWVDKDYIYIAEYFLIEKVIETLYLLEDGHISKETPADGKYVRSREVEKPVITWQIITPFSVHDRRKFPGSRIPVIPILGKEIIIDGIKHYISLTRNMREPQKMLNFFWTAYTEAISNAPKAPFIAEEGQIASYKEQWDNANKQLATLVYKATDIKGNMVPPPQRQPPPEVGMGITQGIQFAAEFMKDTTGIHDAALGMTSNERTGKAIQARTQQSMLATYHFVNSLNRAMRSLGQLLVDIIPVIYDTPRTVRIVGEDMADRVVLVNQIHADPAYPERIYDLKTGKYSVVVTTGPSYDTRRMETADMLGNLMQTAPQLTMIFFDILARVMDMPGGQEIAARAKRFINQQYPGVISDEELGAPEEQLVNQIQQMTQDMQNLMQKSQMDEAQKAQMMEMITTLQKALKDKQDQIAADLQKKEMETAAKMNETAARVDIARMNTHQKHVAHAVDTGVEMVNAAHERAERKKENATGSESRD